MSEDKKVEKVENKAEETKTNEDKLAGFKKSFSGGSQKKEKKVGFGGKRGNDRGRKKGGFKGGKRNDRRKRKGAGDLDSDLSSTVIAVRRVTRVAKGGKRMRFSALVVVGDKSGKAGYAIKKGVDFQGAVSKATRKAKNNMVKININDEGTIDFPIQTKYKAARVFLKPAEQGTGLIAGGYVRPVLELAGVQNIYSKIIGGTNKISGVQAVFEALKTLSKNKKKKVAEPENEEVKDKKEEKKKEFQKQ